MIVDQTALWVNACWIVSIGNESCGDMIRVTVADKRGNQRTVDVFLSELGGYQRFQRGLLRSNIHFANRAFSKGRGRFRKWRCVLNKLVAKAGRTRRSAR